MLDNPPKTIREESSLPEGNQHLKRILPYSIGFGIAAIASLSLIYFTPGTLFHPKDEAFASLEGQVGSLAQRVNALETHTTTSQKQDFNPELVQDIENKIKAFAEEIEVFKRQPHQETSSQGSQTQVFEKDIAELLSIQNQLRAIALFWRLKAKVLSEAPFQGELTDFKTAVKDTKQLSLIEKFADQGLKSLEKESVDPKSLEPKTNSLWDKAKTFATSLIRVEKVSSMPPSSSPSQIRTSIEESLADIENSLYQQLKSTTTPTPTSAEVTS